MFSVLFQIKIIVLYVKLLSIWILETQKKTRRLSDLINVVFSPFDIRFTNIPYHVLEPKE